MEINYDKDADAMYIELRKGKFAKNKKVNEDIILDLDKQGKVLGIELLSVSKNLPNEALSEIHVKNLVALTP